MACVFPLRSRYSVTFRCAGCATVTFGGGGGCGFDCSLQPDRITRSEDVAIQADAAPNRRDCLVREPSRFIPITNQEAGGWTSVHATPADWSQKASACLS